MGKMNLEPVALGLMYLGGERNANHDMTLPVDVITRDDYIRPVFLLLRPLDINVSTSMSVALTQ
jgi:hypothetical protein